MQQAHFVLHACPAQCLRIVRLGNHPTVGLVVQTSHQAPARSTKLVGILSVASRASSRVSGCCRIEQEQTCRVLVWFKGNGSECACGTEATCLQYVPLPKKETAQHISVQEAPHSRIRLHSSHTILTTGGTRPNLPCRQSTPLVFVSLAAGSHPVSWSPEDAKCCSLRHTTAACGCLHLPQHACFCCPCAPLFGRPLFGFLSVLA